MKFPMMEDWGTDISGKNQNIEILRVEDGRYSKWVIDYKPLLPWGEFYTGAMGDLP
jgi:hypothetical protein